MTRNFKHAKNLALRNQRIELKRYSRKVNAYIYTFDFDLDSAKEKCSIKDFLAADLEWMDFILVNRKSRERSHNFDIVMGPTADDDTSLVLTAYFSGLYGDVGSIAAKRQALQLFEAEKLPHQIYFSTNSATQCLVRIGEMEVL